MALETRLDKASKTLTITVSGRFDFGIHQEFRKATEMAETGVSNIIVEMEHVDYLDSSALGMMLVLRDKVGENKSAVRIRNAKPEVKKILEIANFNMLFTLE